LTNGEDRKKRSSLLVINFPCDQITLFHKPYVFASPCSKSMGSIFR
jgi:hypothetical protein